MVVLSWLWEFLSEIPSKTSAVAAFLGGGTGSALVTGVVKSWQDRRKAKLAAINLAERYADALTGFARQCILITGNNRQVDPSLRGMGIKVTTVLPSTTALSKDEGWKDLNSEVRQLTTAFKQHIGEHPLRQQELSIQIGAPDADVRVFNATATTLALEAIDVSEKIREIYKIKRPASLQNEAAGLRQDLQAGKILDDARYRQIFSRTEG